MGAEAGRSEADPGAQALAAVAEKWNPHSRTRADLFGFADVLAVRQGAPVLAVQATSSSNHSARVRKARALPQLRTWLGAGCAFEVWGWAKRKGRWCCRRQALTPADLPDFVTSSPQV